MADKKTTPCKPNRTLHKIFNSFSFEWIIYFLHLSPAPYSFSIGGQHQRMYEILEYESTLELLDTQGKNAIFHKHQRVKFMQDNIIAFQDYAWGEGTNIFASYCCEPGVVVDRYQDGDRWNILISLRGTKHR